MLLRVPVSLRSNVVILVVQALPLGVGGALGRLVGLAAGARHVQAVRQASPAIARHLGHVQTVGQTAPGISALGSQGGIFYDRKKTTQSVG